MNVIHFTTGDLMDMRKRIMNHGPNKSYREKLAQTIVLFNGSHGKVRTLISGRNENCQMKGRKQNIYEIIVTHPQDNRTESKGGDGEQTLIWINENEVTGSTRLGITNLLELFFRDPLCIDRYARWYERSENKTGGKLLYFPPARLAKYEALGAHYVRHNQTIRRRLNYCKYYSIMLNAGGIITDLNICRLLNSGPSAMKKDARVIRSLRPLLCTLPETRLRRVKHVS